LSREKSARRTAKTYVREVFPHVSRDPERFIALVCRELGAVSARILEPGDAAEPDSPPDEAAAARSLRCDMGDGRWAIVTFAEVPADRDAKQRRLEMLVAAFDAIAVDEHPARRSRPPASTSLREELEGLCERAGATNALVIDANSPVVWGAAHPAGIVEVPPLPSGPNLPVEGGVENDGIAGGETATASRRALRVVRGLPEVAALRRGKPLRYVERSGEGPLVAHAFASIYLLVVVFEPTKAFDELRAERAIVESLPRVERLVMALPPHEPDPTQGAGVIAMRRSRRR
jgi:hypothetical protein